MLALFLVAQQGSPTVSKELMMLMWSLILVIFYILLFRPARKRQKKLEEMIGNLKTGDKVITTGGIYGTIDRVKETTLVLKVAEQVKIEIAKNAVAALQSPEESK